MVYTVEGREVSKNNFSYRKLFCVPTECRGKGSVKK